MGKLEFRVDPETKSLVKVTEAAVSPEELRVELQAEADAAQNRLNAANEAKSQSAAALVAAQELDDANAVEVEAADEEVKFSSARVGELDEAVSVLDSLVGATPEGENAEDSADESDGSEEVEVPVHLAENAPA